MQTSPIAIVLTAATVYGVSLQQLLKRDRSFDQVRVLVKSISACHSVATTAFALVALNQQSWRTPNDEIGVTGSKESPVNGLDDSRNPVIAGKNRLANWITAWEAGYLIYDTGALYLTTYSKIQPQGHKTAVARFLKDSPVFVIHHVGLVAALLYLQTYVADGREKGLWVIMAFICQNASTPFLHLRWWYRHKSGKRSRLLDVTSCFVFALARFGTVLWVMRKYGQYHSRGAWEAFLSQRLPCKAGTGLLTGMNFAWWVGLLMQTISKPQQVTT